MNRRTLSSSLHRFGAFLVLVSMSSIGFAFDQDAMQKQIDDFLYVKPVPEELTDPNLSPAEIQQRQRELQEVQQQEQVDRETAKQARLNLLYEITYRAFESLKNEGVIFDDVRTKIQDVVELNDTQDFAIGNAVTFNIYENPSYLCPQNTDCIRIDAVNKNFMGECTVSINGTPYIPGNLPSYEKLGVWTCDAFVGDETKTVAIDAVRKFVVNQMRKGVTSSGAGNALSREYNKAFQDFSNEVFSNLPR